METQIIIACIVGLLIGGVLTWLVSKSRFQREIAEKTSELEGKAKYAEGQVEQLKTQVSHADEDFGKMRIELDEEKGKSIETVVRLEEATRNLEQQKELVTLMKNEMVETFKAHASSALETSNRSFLQLAQEHLGKIIEQTKGKLGEHQASMEATVKPLQEILKRYEEELKTIEKDRSETYGSLAQSIQSLTKMSEQLQRETSTLVVALRKPQVSGSWGQMSLKRAAELAGMVPYCDFYERFPSMLRAADSGRI